MNMRKYLYFFNLLALFFLIQSCNLFNKNTKKIDVSGIELQLNLDRFDDEFFACDTNQIYASLSQLREKDSLFFDFYTMNVMRFGKIADTTNPTMLDLHHFFTN